MTTDVTKTNVLFSSAPLEPVSFTETPYNMIVHIELKKTSISVKIADLIKSYLEGCGNVDLHHIDLVVVTTAASQTVKAGMCDAGSSATINHVSMKANGVHFTSTSYNYGVKNTHTLEPEGTLSRQIQPVSSNLPMIKLLVEKAEAASVQLDVYIKIHGVRQVYSSF